MNNLVITALIASVVFCACEKHNSSSKCTIHFESNKSLKYVAYVFNGIEYQKFNAIGKEEGTGFFSKIDSLKFKLDTVIDMNELSSLGITSLLKHDTVIEADYRIIMTLGSEDKIVYEKEFKESSYTGSLIEF